MKNPPKVRGERDGPPPVVRSCERCGLDITSRYQAKTHICRKGATDGPR